MEKPPWPWPVVSLKGTMGPWDGAPKLAKMAFFITRPPRRIMTFPETLADLNRLVEKIKPELGSESFKNCKNTFSACTRVRTDGHTFFHSF